MQQTAGRRYGLDVIVLFGMLAFSLLAAWLVVLRKSLVPLTPPIELPYSGLSVSLPTGGSWQRSAAWTYDRDGYTLGASRIRRSAGRSTHVQWRYVLAADPRAPQEQFEARAEAIGAVVTRTGQQTVGDITVAVATLEEPKTAAVLLAGIASLPGGRGLVFEVFEPGGDSDAATKLFDRVVASVQFTDNALLQAGQELIQGIRAKGLDEIIGGEEGDDAGPQVFFVIRDAGNRIIGFTMDMLTDAGPQNPLNIRAASYHYIGGRMQSQHITLLQADSHLEKFGWKTEAYSPAGVTASQLAADGTDMLLVIQSAGPDRQIQRRLGPGAIPDLLTDMVVRVMLDTQFSEVILDTINPDGTVAPLLLRRIAYDSEAEQTDAAYVVEGHELDGSNHSFTAQFDRYKRPLTVLLRREVHFTLERTTVGTIFKLFPEQAEAMLKNSKLEDEDS